MILLFDEQYNTLDCHKIKSSRIITKNKLLVKHFVHVNLNYI